MKKAMAVFGSASALALVIGIGGIGVNPAGGPPTATHQPSAVPSAPGAAPGHDGTAVHVATLVGCVAGLDC